MEQHLRVGLEIHGYIDVDTKLFCNCKIDHNAEPNTTVCPICTGQPGSKPMATNRKAVDKAIAIALLLGCEVNERLLFQRKHYSWPDMPSGYQKTMSGSYAAPVGEHGVFRNIRIAQCHLEEDPARWDPQSGCVDYNRAGYPLIEIVTEPDFSSSQQVGEWLKQLIVALSYINAIHKQAGIKSDVNVSIAPKFERVEIKNVNSISSIVRAIDVEAQRQDQEVAAGKPIPLHTRRYDDANETTQEMRSKETADDYMFIPDPDLPVITISKEMIKEIQDMLPETPEVKMQKLVEMGIKQEDAKVLSNDFVLIDLFEKVSKEVDPVLAARWLRRELVRVANYNKLDLEELKLDETHLIALLKLFEAKKITDSVAQRILEQLVDEPFDVDAYVEREGLLSTDDQGELEKICKEVMDEQPKAVEDYKSGNQNSLHFLIGQVMRKTRGRSQPDVVHDVFKSLLK